MQLQNNMQPKQVLGQKKKKKVVCRIKGVTGLTVLHGVPKFSLTWGEATDLLHSAYEGIGKLILEFMVNSKSKPWSFEKLNGADLEYFDDIASNANFFSELKRFLTPLPKFGFWKAFDFLIFFLYVSGPMCCEPDEICSEFYDMIVDFSDSVFWLSYAYTSYQSIRYAEKSVATFSENFLKIFGKARATHKFHTFQHLPRLVKEHGPATNIDSFDGETHPHREQK
jgi:hypothetical protein